MGGCVGRMPAEGMHEYKGRVTFVKLRCVLGNVGGIASRALVLVVVDIAVIIEGVYTFLGLGIFNPLTGQTTSGGVGNVVWLVSSAVVFVGACVVWRPRRVGCVLVAAVFAAVVTAGLVDITYLTLHPAMLACCLALALVAFGLGYVLSGMRAAFVLSLFVLSLATCELLAFSLHGHWPVATSTVRLEAGQEDSIEWGSKLLEKAHAGVSPSELTPQEMADFAQRIVHVEMERLGLPGPEPEVKVGITRGSNGSFVPADNAIVLSVNYARAYTADGHDVLAFTVFHEMAHAYEHALVTERIDFEADSPLGELTQSDVEQWRREMSTFVDGITDYEAYAARDIEVRANDYVLDEFYWYLFWGNVEDVSEFDGE